MASRTYFGNYKAYVAPAVADLEAPTVGELQATGAFRVERLLADNGVTFNAQEGNVSQDLLDEGKTSEDVGIRSVTGLQLTWQLEFDDDTRALDDDNWDFFGYGEKANLVVILDGRLEDDEDEDDLEGRAAHTFAFTSHDPVTMAPSGNAKQNARVSLAVDDWSFKAVVGPTVAG